MQYAIINSEGEVINLVEWDGEAEWGPGEGLKAVKAEENAIIGSTYKDGNFTLPPVPEVPVEDLISAAEAEKTSLIGMASQKISILQDAVDLDMASEDEVSSLASWKKYRVLLNRVDATKAPDLSWPEAPQ